MDNGRAQQIAKAAVFGKRLGAVKEDGRFAIQIGLIRTALATGVASFPES
jgi:hypothetical protein